jgi:Ca2+-binding EF-hand superfamily protein
MKRLLSFIVAIAVVDAASTAETTAPAKPATSRVDVQDLVYVQPEGALRLRFHISIDGKAPTAQWAAFLDKVFAWYDRDNDKFLNAAELGRLSNLAQMSQGFNFVFNGRQPNQQGPRIADYDANKDGKIDREEFQAFARKVGFVPIVVSIFPPNRQAELLTDAFYKHVNVKKDGKLTKSELAGAWNILRRLDIDEDELISNLELQQKAQSLYGEEVEVQQLEEVQGRRMAPQQTPSPFIAIPLQSPESSYPQLIQQLLAQKCKSPFVLNLPMPANLPKFARELVHRFDHDAIRNWLNQPADLEFSVAIGDVSEGLGRLVRLGDEPPGVMLKKPAGKEPALAKALKTGSDGILRLTLSDARIELGKGFNQSRNFDGNSVYYINQYKDAAGEKKYLDKESIQQNPYIQFLANLFEDADKNGDGKLYVDELTAFLSLLKGGPGAQTSVTVSDQGRALYAVLDENNNQSLSQREVLNLLAKFDELDRNKDGALERTELLRQFQVVTNIGMSGGGIRAINVVAMNNTPRGSSAGPAWFQKMDRNKDGDVSPREFLGTPEEFQKFDLNNDGLISAAEAKKLEEVKKINK